MDQNVICFHLTTEPNGYLSNWYRSPFELNGTRYTCVEQCLMHRKALMFGDTGRAEKIMATEDPAQMKALGRAVAGYDGDVWEGSRQLVAWRALRAKFSQDAVLRERLLATGDAMLAECAAGDRVWGIGLGMDDPGRLSPTRWRGRNLLGFTLMIVREELRERLAGEGRKLPLIHAFANRLRHAAKALGEQGIIYAISPEEMQSMGFEMDCGNSWHDTYGIDLGDVRALQLKYDQVDYPLMLGNAIFSYWRYYTHWANEAMDDGAVRWFELAARRLEEITGRA